MLLLKLSVALAPLVGCGLDLIGPVLGMAFAEDSLPQQTNRTSKEKVIQSRRVETKTATGSKPPRVTLTTAIPWSALLNCSRRAVPSFDMAIPGEGKFSVHLNECAPSQVGPIGLAHAQTSSVKTVRTGYVARPSRPHLLGRIKNDTMPQRVVAIAHKRGEATTLTLTFSAYRRPSATKDSVMLRHFFLKITDSSPRRTANVPHRFLVARLEGDLMHQHHHAMHREASPQIAGSRPISRPQMPDDSGLKSGRMRFEHLAANEAVEAPSNTSSTPLGGASSTTGGMASTHFLSLTTQTDASFDARPDADLSLLAMISGADTMYRDNFGLGLNLVAAFSSTDGIALQAPAPDASSRLRSFITSTMPLYGTKSDAAVLITTQDIGGALVGLAALGGACTAVGGAVIQSINPAIDYLILAHELGHLLSATHTTSGIMSSTVSLKSPATAFAPESLQQITSFLSNHVACFEQGPSSSEATLTTNLSSELTNLPPQSETPQPVASPASPLNGPSPLNGSSSLNGSAVNENAGGTTIVTRVDITQETTSNFPLPLTTPLPPATTTTPNPELSVVRIGSLLVGEITLDADLPSCSIDIRGLIDNPERPRVRLRSLAKVPATQKVAFSIRLPRQRRNRIFGWSMEHLPSMKMRADLVCPTSRARRSSLISISGDRNALASMPSESYMMALLRSSLKITETQ